MQNLVYRLTFHCSSLQHCGSTIGSPSRNRLFHVANSSEPPPQPSSAAPRLAAILVSVRLITRPGAVPGDVTEGELMDHV
ncbi:hypothetical protein FKM82_020263 [Ascaphus truei]